MTVGANTEPVEPAPQWVRDLAANAFRRRSLHRGNAWDEVAVIVVHPDVIRDHLTDVGGDPETPGMPYPTLFGMRVVGDPALGPREARLRYDCGLDDLAIPVLLLTEEERSMPLGVPDSPAEIDTPLHRVHAASKAARESGETVEQIVNVALFGATTPEEQRHLTKGET